MCLPRCGDRARWGGDRFSDAGQSLSDRAAKLGQPRFAKPFFFFFFLVHLLSSASEQD